MNRLLLLTVMLIAAAGLRAQSNVFCGYAFTTGLDTARWIDIQPQLDLTYPLYSQNVQLPFRFTFHNRTYTSVKIYRNGAVIFGSTPQYQEGTRNPQLPYSDGFDISGIWGFCLNMVAGFFTYCTAPDTDGYRVFVMQFKPIGLYAPSGRTWWQVQLHERDGSVVMAYNLDYFLLYDLRFVGVQFHPGQSVAVPLQTNTPTMDYDESVFTSGWPGIGRYYCFTPVDTVCLPPMVEGVETYWDVPDSARIVWQGCDRYQSYSVEYGPRDFILGTGTLVAVADTEVSISGLIPGERYDAYITPLRTDSTWCETALVSFRMPCSPIADNPLVFYDLNASNVVCQYGIVGLGSESIGVLDAGSLSPYSRHTVHSNREERDFRTKGVLRTVPENHCVSVRLGNWLNNAEKEMCIYTLHVDTNNYDLLLLRYAVVAESPGHELANNPQFEFDITDSAGGHINDCYHGYFVTGDTSGWQQGYGEAVWRDWDVAGVDLSPLHGRTVKVVLTSKDCAQTGHYGYGYFTLEGGHKHFRSTSCSEAVENTFFAPEGFSYRWYAAANSGVTLSQADTFHVADTGVYCCEVSHHLSGHECSFVMSTYMGTRYPVAAFDRESMDSCRTVVRFDNHSVIARDSAHTQLTSYPCEEIFWRFDDGTTSREEHVLHRFTTGGLHWVTLYAMLAGGSCVDSLTDTFYLDIPRDTVFDTVCSGTEYYFYGKKIVEPGVYNIIDTCVEHVLVLEHNPVYHNEINDTIELGEMYSFGGLVFDGPVKYRKTYSSVSGCDSVEVLYLCSREHRYRVVCQRDLPFSWMGCFFYGAGTDTLHFTPQNGGDSLVVLHLGVRSVPESRFEIEPLCDSAGGYALNLSDTLCYEVRSLPHDGSLPEGRIQLDERDWLRMVPDTVTMYRILVDYCDTVSCAVEDTVLLAPSVPVKAFVYFNPDFLTEQQRHVTARDGSVNGTERQWYVDGVLQADTGRSLAFSVDAERDSAVVMLVANNCTCSDTAYGVIAVKQQALWFPNVFTPDESGNNVFRGYGVNVRDYELMIFTRWGDCIFHTRNIDEAWNGTYRGVKSPESAYAYLCRYTTLDGEPRVVTGTVTLVR